MARSPDHLILVIDDEQVVLDAAARLLSAEGYEVLTAADAEHGIRLLESRSPDLALVDLKLPGMSGLDFLDAALKDAPDLHIVLTTGVSSAEQAVAAMNHGAFDFLPKPFTYEELMSPVLRAYRHKELILKGAVSAPGSGDADLLFMGLQAWAHPKEAHRIRLGVTGLFQQTAGTVREVVLPKINTEIRQGGPLARIRADDGHWHVALAAAGGRVVEVNGRLADSPGLLNRDPSGAGWIAELQSTEFHRDLPNLRPADAHVP